VIHAVTVLAKNHCSFMKSGFSANGHDDDEEEEDSVEDCDYGDSCDMWSNLQVKLKITISCEESVPADDVQNRTLTKFSIL
jgi:hypothetical protein